MAQWSAQVDGPGYSLVIRRPEIRIQVLMYLCTHPTLCRGAVARPFPANCGKDLDARTQVHAPSPQWLPRENHHASHSTGIWLVPAESLPPLMTLSPRNCYTRENHGYKTLPWSQESSPYTLSFSLYSWLLVWDVLPRCACRLSWDPYGLHFWCDSMHE